MNIIDYVVNAIRKLPDTYVEYIDDGSVENCATLQVESGSSTYIVKMHKLLTQEDAQKIYNEWSQLHDEDQIDEETLRDLSEDELHFLSEVIASDRLEDIYWDYSGRGMHGRPTLGVQGAAFSTSVSHSVDSLGRGLITYVR